METNFGSMEKTMHSYLEDILKEKQREVAILKQRKSMKDALRSDKLSVIAEIKRQSPSLGKMRDIQDPLELAKQYIEGGASAISVLTDSYGFKGSIEDLKSVVSAFDIPVLRKDFIVDSVQLGETISAGASAVLLIVAVLENRIGHFISLTKELGLDALVEVHDEKELELAIKGGAEIIGVNNRNLSSFVVDTSIALRLAPLIPSNVIRVAESGIKTKEDALMVRRAGFDAVLVGEALVKSDNPQNLIQELKV